MLTLDGSGGGGQLVRTAVTFAALTGEAVEIAGVRGSRDPPGLRPQHVTAIAAAAALCDAETSPLEPGAETVTFRPGDLRGGEFAFDVGTAGSATLVTDTLLPLAVGLDDPATVSVTGGTDVQHAPPADYLRHVKLPVLRSLGLDARVTVDRRGFYPAGGGELTIRLARSSLDPFDLTSRGSLDRLAVHSVASADLAGADVAARQADGAVSPLDPVAPVTRDETYAESRSTGGVLTLVADYGSHRAGFSALGERGIDAADVGTAAAADFRRFAERRGAVDRHLADQLLPYLALAGGHVTTPARTRHVDTCATLLRDFDYALTVREQDGVVDLRSPAP